MIEIDLIAFSAIATFTRGTKDRGHSRNILAFFSLAPFPQMAIHRPIGDIKTRRAATPQTSFKFKHFSESHFMSIKRANLRTNFEHFQIFFTSPYAFRPVWEIFYVSECFGGSEMNGA